MLTSGTPPTRRRLAAAAAGGAAAVVSAADGDGATSLRHACGNTVGSRKFGCVCGVFSGSDGSNTSIYSSGAPPCAATSERAAAAW